MARKNFSDEFRRQAVELYESTPGATVRGIAEDLGIERGTPTCPSPRAHPLPGHGHRLGRRVRRRGRRVDDRVGQSRALRVGLPYVALPTTYAGSEMTPVWGLTDKRAEADRPRPGGAARGRC